MSEETQTVWERMREELEAQERVAQEWQPEEGEILLGTLLYTQQITGEYGTTPIAMLEDADSGETVAVWLKHKILQREWEGRKPEPGDRIGIKYLGEESGKNGKYHAYVLKVEHENSGA